MNLFCVFLMFIFAQTNKGWIALTNVSTGYEKV